MPLDLYQPDVVDHEDRPVGVADQILKHRHQVELRGVHLVELTAHHRQDLPAVSPRHIVVILQEEPVAGDRP